MTFSGIDMNGDFRSLAWFARHPKLRVHPCGALLHPLDSEPLACLVSVRSDAVVMDAKIDARALVRQLDVDAAGTGMAQRVRDCLLSNTQEMVLRFGRQSPPGTAHDDGGAH